jgi:hypothetical protein
MSETQKQVSLGGRPKQEERPCHPDDLSFRCFWLDFRRELVLIARSIRAKLSDTKGAG